MRSSHLQQDALQYADRIEAEMRRIGWWQNAPLRPEQLHFKQAFAMDTMTLAQWLQFIFLPRVREAAASNEFPSGSSVGAHARLYAVTAAHVEDCLRYSGIAWSSRSYWVWCVWL